MERVVTEYQAAGSLHWVTLEVTNNMPLVRQAGIKAVPHSLIFSGGLVSLFFVLRRAHPTCAIPTGAL